MTFDAGSTAQKCNLNTQDNRDVSPRKVACADETWNKYETLAGDINGASQLRCDPGFLDKLLQVL